MMKVVNKKEIIDVLGLNALAVKETDKNLFEMMVYTSKSLEKDEKSVTKKDLLDLLKDVKETLGDKYITEPQKEVVVETSTKKTIKKSRKEEPAKKEIVEIFPEGIEWGKDLYVRCNIKNMDELYQALSNDEEIFVGFHLTKEYLTNNSYFDGQLGNPKSFYRDLDMSTIIYISEEKRVAYALSLTTEALYNIVPFDFVLDDNGYKDAGGIEFEFYRKDV